MKSAGKPPVLTILPMQRSMLPLYMPSLSDLTAVAEIQSGLVSVTLIADAAEATTRLISGPMVGNPLLILCAEIDR